MKKTKLTRSLLAACSIVALTAVMYGCVHDGGGDDTMDTGMEMPEPTPYETAKAAIAAASTAAAAQAAYDAVKDDVTAAEGEKLQAAVDARIVAINTMARATMQMAALTTASGNVDTSDLSTQADIDAAQMAIDALQMAIDNAADVDDTSMYETQVTTAQMAVNTAQGNLDTMDRMTAQRMAIMSAVRAARTAVGMVNDDATDAQVTAAEDAVTALEAAIDGAADIPAGDPDVASAQGTLATLSGQLSTAKMSRTAAMEADEKEEERKAAEAMAATAAKLYAGISAPMGDTASAAAGDRAASYNADGTAILVSAGLPAATPAVVPLSLDEDTEIDKLQDWTGARYMAEPDGDAGTYEAVVYSNIEDPEEGEPFSEQYSNNFGDGELDEATTEGTASRVASPSFDHSAGVKEFELATNNLAVMIPGTYHGVSGTYSCVPGADSTCAVQVASEGFTLGSTADAGNAFTASGGTWTFEPDDANANVMEVDDDAYASYGWWLHKSEDGTSMTASAFHDFNGTDTPPVNLPEAGTATYSGGAAGKYALQSSTGGTNDAGHFTARATLEAEFGAADANTISGTIDQFIGADGESRDWSVELKEGAITDAGAITRTDADDTAWTIGGTAAAASGEWSGNLREQGDDGVPQVATGTFYTEYGTAGRMVGAFGANEE